MGWRGDISTGDRVLGSIPYVLPMVQALPYGAAVYTSLPIVATLVSPLIPLFPILEGNFLISLAIFFGLFILVVRNTKIAHFIRFNTGQALILTIALSLASIVFRIVLYPFFTALGLTILSDVLLSALFFGTFAICIYSIVQNFRGHYAEIPTLSDAVYMQVR